MSVRFISEQEMQKAATLVRNTMMENLPKEPEGQFSGGFDCRILEMKNTYKHQEQRKQTRRRFTAAAAAFLVTATLLFSLNTEVRAAVVTWFKEVYETRIVYWFNAEKANTLPDFEIVGLPEGYECIYDEATSNSRNCLYQIEDVAVDGFSFGYSLIQGEAPLTVEFFNGEFEIRNVSINGCPGELYISLEPTESHALVWIDEANGVVFTVTSFLDTDNILHIAESVELMK